MEIRDRRQLRSVHGAFLCTLLAMFFSTGLFGQTFTGHVTDSSGAFVPGATITVHNQLTNVDAKTKTTGAGVYTIPYLLPGLYSVSAEMNGFQKQVRSGITLPSDSTVEVDFTLKVGSSAVTVTVSADQEMIDTDNASLSETLPTQTVTEVPNNGRDIDMAAILSTSVNYFDVNDGSVTGLEAGSSNYGGGWFTMSINGAQYGSSIELMDGLPNDSVAGSGPGVQQTVTTASLESVQDFKVIANAYDARYGNGAGGGFDTIIKSGTNALHGSIYEYARRTWLNANPWVTDYYANTSSAAANAAPQSTEDFYGVEADGPVVIPHVYDGRNRTFFLLQYDSHHQVTPGTTIDSVPNCASWNATGQKCDFTNVNTIGDFSKLYSLGSNGVQQHITLYDPLSGTPTNRIPFPNNTIPACVGSSNLSATGGACINPTAMKILSYFPAPNVAAPSNTNPFDSDYYTTWNSNTEVRNIMGKFDENFTHADRFSLRGTLTTNSNSFANLFGSNYFPGPAGGGEGGNSRGWSIEPEWVHTFSPSLVLAVRTSGGYAITFQQYTDTNFDLTTFGGGWTKALVSQLANFGKTFPQFSFSSDGITALGASLPPNWLSGTSFNFFPEVTWVKGKHAIYAGLDMRYRQEGYLGVPGGQGFGTPKFKTGHAWTRKNYQSSPALQGFSVASFLLGDADSGSVNIVVNRTYSTKYYAPFVQDDWKITRKLTLNLGLRYDLSPGVTERHNEMNYAFDTTSVNPVNAQVNDALVGGALVGGFTFAGVNGNPRSATALSRLGLQPRFGFAYSVNPKLVIRGGFEEMLSGPLLTYSSFVQNGLVGFSAKTTYINSLNSGQTPNPNANVSNPYPQGVTPITGSSTGLLTALGQGGTFYNPNYKEQSYWGFSVGFQEQLSPHDVLGVSYVGSHTYDLGTNTDINLISPAWQRQCDQGSGGDPTICNSDLVQNPFYGVSAFSTASAFSNTAPTVSQGQLDRPFPAFSDMYEVDNDGRSWYNSVQVTLEHRWANALTLHGGWTWQKTMDAGAWADQRYDLRQRTIDSLDMPKKISIFGVYNLPLGRGHLLLGNANRIVDGAIGGWELGSDYSFITGMPVVIDGVYMNSYASVPLQNEDPLRTRAFLPCTNQWVQANNGTWSLQDVGGYNYSGNCNQFNFTQVPQYGETPSIDYTGIRSRPTELFDVNLSKLFSIHERLKLQFRLDAFNALNHPQFGTIPSEFDTDSTDGDFGTYNKLNGSNSPRNVELALKLLW